MDRSYWEKIAPSYNEEIFDVLHHDKSGVIVSTIKGYRSKNKSVIDIGCAVGKWIPVLSPLFKKVIAVDISKKNIELAKKNCTNFKNVEYGRVDMTNPRLQVGSCDFAICINAILTGTLKKRIIFFHSLAKCLKKGGWLILVVPSLESFLYTSIIRERWKVDKGTEEKNISPKKALQKLKNFKQGNADIDGVPTKHYLKEELILLLAREGFQIETIKKVEYNWKTEFNRPPRWLHKPYPWDWMVVAKKITKVSSGL
jgi:2-polyprenyl-3-methyl-5-hydroxy-6-metoxy-1,4-benzoquinol methylase